MAFPSNPNPGDTYTDAYGTVWVYAGLVNGWYRQTVYPINDTTYIGSDGAPGGAGGNTQVVFNDNGSLAGDSGLTYNKTSDTLTSSKYTASLGTAAAPSVYFGSDTNTGLYSPGADQLALSTNGTGRLFVDADGRVRFSTAGLGINRTAQINFDLDVNGLSIFRGTTYINNLNGISGDTTINSPGGQSLIFKRANLEVGRFDSSGRLGIGTGSPSYKLHLGGDATASVNGQIALGSVANTPSARVDGYRVDGTFSGQLHLYTTNSSGAQTRAVTIDQSQRVGIGTTNPGRTLEVSNSATGGGIRVRTTTTTVGDESRIEFSQNGQGSGDNIVGVIRGISAASSSGELAFNTVASGAGSEAFRIDSSGRLLVGTSSARSNFYNGTGLSSTVQFEATHASPGLQGRFILSNNTSGSQAFEQIFLKSGAATTGSYALVSNDDRLALISFQGTDGSEGIAAASIEAFVDGTPGANDMPGRLVFRVTADGAASPTEALRITNDRYVRLASGSGGIQFNGDTAAANALDDYEEGTFTPVLNGTATVGTGTYTLQQGRYTKIGRTVSIDIVLTWTAHTGVGNMFITGLPFTFGVGFGYRAPLAINTTGVSATVAYGDGAYSNISIPTAIAGSGTIYINGSYQV